MNAPPIVIPIKRIAIDSDRELRVLVCPYCTVQVVAGTLPGALAWCRAHLRHCAYYQTNALRYSAAPMIAAIATFLAPYADLIAA